jgi:serine/threonine protein phosphatase PrpC
MAKNMWRVDGRRVRGAVHKRNGIPCQDAIDQSIKPLILAVADGHGSQRSPKSDIGASLAVTEVAKRELNKMARLATQLDLESVKRLAEQNLPKAIVRGWWKEVSKKEFGASAVEEDQPPSKDVLVKYGTTLLAVLVTDRFILYVQIGDGDILIVDADGHTERVFQKDERLIANETTSLCTTDAWVEFQIHFQVLNDNPPTLILVATDGYSNSFRTKEDFYEIGADYLANIRTEGFDVVVSDYLEDWLNKVSQQGSGDDVTLGLIYREENENVSAS